MEGLQPVATLPRARTPGRTLSVPGWLREQVTTTPGKLSLISILVVAGAVCFGVLATAAEHDRAQAAQAVRSKTEPLLVQAATVYATLADANATATATFLRGGLEPPARLAHYNHDLKVASGRVAALTHEVGGSAGASTAVTTVTEELPVYSGLVEAARANNRQGFPIGAAYLRQASGLLGTTILPGADHLYAAEANRLGVDYDSGTASGSVVVLAIVFGAAFVLLILAQVYLAHVSKRVINVPMLVATLLLAGVSIWAIVGMVGEQNALARARRDGSDSVEVLSATRVLLSRAQSDESLTLVNRGSDDTDPIDFTRVMRVLEAPGGLLQEANLLAQRTGTGPSARQFTADFAAYRAQTGAITGLEHRGLIGPAIGLGSSASSYALADRLNADLEQQISAAQARFERAASDATSSVSGLTLAIPVVTVLVALLALVGIRQRLREYR